MTTRRYLEPLLYQPNPSATDYSQKPLELSISCIFFLDEHNNSYRSLKYHYHQPLSSSEPLSSFRHEATTLKTSHEKDLFLFFIFFHHPFLKNLKIQKKTESPYIIPITHKNYFLLRLLLHTSDSSFTLLTRLQNSKQIFSLAI